jgi:diguanylate cyclase
VPISAGDCGIRDSYQERLMTTLRRGLLGLTFVGLLAVLGILYSQTQALDIEVQNQVTLDLRKLRQRDAEWNAAILKTRIGTDHALDTAATPQSILDELQRDIARLPAAANNADARQALQKLNATFAGKTMLVAQFKLQNASLRNSLYQFPLTTDAFSALLANTAGAGPQVQALLLYALDSKVGSLLTCILKFNLLPDPTQGRKVIAAIDEVERYKKSYPEEIVTDLLKLTGQARLILQQRTSDDRLMASIAATSTVADMDALGGALDKMFQDALNAKQRYRTYLFIYSGLLLLLLASAARRLVKSYKIIAHVNRQLKAVNETLEQRVAERTAELEKQSAQLAQLASYDILTGLINRGQLMLRLKHALKRAERRYGTVVVVMFIDLDGFKAVNDTYGHAFGDRVLTEVAARVQQHLRQEDAMARLGGDEFVILLEDVGSREGALRVAEQTLAAINGIANIGGYPVVVSASIGISHAVGRPGTETFPDDLLSQADHAMYQAKQGGKNHYRFSASSDWE